jgi:Tfp pilus assembly protein PilO
MGARERLILSVIAAIVVVAGVWLIVVAPERSQASNLLAQITSERQAVASAQAQVASERVARASYAGEVHALRVLLDAIPTSDQLPQLINLINTLESGHVIDWKTTSFTSSGGGGFNGLSISFSFTANYQNLQRFIAALDAMNQSNGSDVVTTGRLVTVNSLQLSADANHRESASVAMTVYQQPSQGTTGGAGALTTAAPGQ